ncbi:MAG: hypothetical protein KJ709_06560 [Nanoarchaeota archaeon]|nr:hypothetical protein [Nanoarchaeota archaeon]
MQAFEKEFIDFFVGVFRGFGMDSLSAKLVAILYMEPEEVSMEDLAKKTGYCLASVSNKLRFLESVGQIQRRKHPGTKKVYYYMHKDIARVLKGKLEKSRQSCIGPMKEVLPRIIGKYRNAKMGPKEKAKMAIINDYYRQVTKIEKMMEKMMDYLENLS